MVATAVGRVAAFGQRVRENVARVIVGKDDVTLAGQRQAGHAHVDVAVGEVHAEPHTPADGPAAPLVGVPGRIIVPSRLMSPYSVWATSKEKAPDSIECGDIEGADKGEHGRIARISQEIGERHPYDPEQDVTAPDPRNQLHRDLESSRYR